ncbi:UNVERIFIED_ORG: hypothetical protein B5F06_13710 [Lacrimispora saccharolytica]
MINTKTGAAQTALNLKSCQTGSLPIGSVRPVRLKQQPAGLPPLTCSLSCIAGLSALLLLLFITLSTRRKQT